jgi:pimeloyl-ACP methyl ester carboxylesterase
VNIGGHRLHILEAGEGSPAVVVVPALGDGVLGWLRVQRALAADTRVVLYERAGTGWSDPPPRGRQTPAGMAAELKLLLQAAGVAPPYVLAAHSLGGVVARQFAARYPGDVTGIVLVDSSHEQQGTRFRLPGGLPSGVRHLARAVRLRLRWLGGRRLWYAMRAARGWREDLSREIPAEHAAAARALWLSTRHRQTVVRESLVLAFPGPAPASLGDIPLTVLTQALREGDDDWERLQRELASLSSDSRHVVASDCGHYMHLDDLGLVVREIKDLLARITPPPGDQPGSS